MIPSLKEIIFLGAALLGAMALLCLVVAIIVGGFVIVDTVPSVRGGVASVLR